MRHLFGKLLALALAPLLIGTGLVLGLFWSEGRAALTTELSEEAASGLRAEEEKIAGHFDAIRAQLRLAASLPALRAAEPAPAVEALRALQRSWSGQIEALYFNTAAGEVYGTDGARFSVRDRDYFAQIDQGQEVATGVIQSRASGRPIVLLLVPIWEEGRRVGAVGATVLVSDLLQRIRQVHNHHGGAALLVDERGEIVSSSLEGANEEAVIALTQEALRSSGVSEGEHLGEPVTIFARGVRGTRWAVAFYYQDRDLFAARDRQVWLGAGILLVLAGIAAAGAYLSKRILGGASHELGAALDAVAAGDLSRRAGDLSRDQLGELATSFDRMASRLEEEQRARLAHEESRRQAEEALRTLQEKLLQAQKLEAIGTLAGGVAHDFNNLLVAILANLDLAKSAAPPGTAAHNALSDAHTAGLRARDLVRQILAFSRRTEAKKRAFDFGLLAEETIRLLRVSAPPAVALRLELAPALPLVMADPSQLQQVLINLGTNAFHAMEGTGGELLLSARAEAGQLVISLRDQGTGIAPEHLARIFDPFFTTKPVGKGSGLGLSVAHGIIIDHGGTIDVESAPGRGTTFVLRLPAAPADAVPGPITPIPDPPARPKPQPTPTPLEAAAVRPYHGLVVVLVEDEPFVLKACERMLRRLGCEVVSFSDPRQALAALVAGGRADLVLTDLNMPLLSGSALALELQSQRPGLPVILMSGYVDEASSQLTREGGIAGLLHKPFSPEQLGEAIAQVRRREA